MNRNVEIFAGAYTSGKSEIAINRALMLSKLEPISLVDLDTVEPAYTLRPLKKELDKIGLNVVTQEDYFGLGEAGNIITPKQLNCLAIEGTLVIDVGYGVGGLDILEILTGINEEENLNINIVINTSKPETSTVENILEYMEWSKGDKPQAWKKFTGIISNTHFGDFTEKDDIIRGYEITKEAAEKLNIPIKAIGVPDNLFEQFASDCYDGVPLWKLTRYMPRAFW